MANPSLGEVRSLSSGVGAKPREHAIRSRARQERLTNSAIFVVLSIGAILMLIPFEWALATAFSADSNIAIPFPPRFWPEDPSTFNFTASFRNVPMLRFYFNTAVVTASVVLAQLITCSLGGYAFAKGQFVGKSILFILVLATIMIPLEVRMIPMYLMVSGYHINNNFLGLILPSAGSAFGVFLMMQYMKTVPTELIEAARMDGAHEFLTFWRIALPLCGPALAALAILTALNTWNDFLWPLLVISDNNLYTITLGIAMYQQQQGGHAGFLLATTTTAVLPIIVLFIILQRYIIQGIAFSGLKGGV